MPLDGKATTGGTRSRVTHAVKWWRSSLGAVVAAVLLLFGTGTGALALTDGSGYTGPGLPGFTQGNVAVEGGTLHYVRGGSGPAVVLLHGWPETWWEWRKVMPSLAADHTVIAFDLPGLGSSSVPSGGYDAKHTAARIHEAVTKLGYQQVQLLTHDVGSIVAYPYAHDFPSGVSRLIVIESALNGFGLENAYGLSWHFGFNMAARPVPENIINDQAHVNTYLGWLFSSAVHPDQIAQTEFFRAYGDAAHRSAGYDYYRAYPTNATDNQASAAQKLTIPIVAMGAKAVFGASVAQSWQQVASDVRTVVAPDTGHWIPEENAQFVIDCSKLFFGPPSSDPPTGDLAGCAP